MNELFSEPPSFPPDELTDQELFGDLAPPPSAKILPFKKTAKNKVRIYANRGQAMTYMHKETGTIQTREDWICSYDSEELEARGISAEQAFKEDQGRTLLEVNHER